MIAIVIEHNGRHIPAELVGVTDLARIPGCGFLPRSWKSAKQARRAARRMFGAGALDPRKFRVACLPRGQSMQCGHLVKVEVAA